MNKQEVKEVEDLTNIFLGLSTENKHNLLDKARSLLRIQEKKILPESSNEEKQGLIRR